MHGRLTRSLGFMVSSYIWLVQKHHQLQILADTALQSQTDPDLEHKYDDKVLYGCMCMYVCVYIHWCTCTYGCMYVSMYLCMNNPLLGKYSSFWLPKQHTTRHNRQAHDNHCTKHDQLDYFPSSSIPFPTTTHSTYYTRTIIIRCCRSVASHTTNHQRCSSKQHILLR